MYVKRYAFTNARKGFSKTYVAVYEGQNQVQGYYSISVDGVALDLMPTPAGMPSKVPLLLIGRLAVDNANQNRGLGTDLLMHAFQTSMKVAEAVGIYAVAVDALNERVKHFYEKFGFTPFTDSSLHLFLPLDEIRPLFPAESNT